MSIVIAAKTDEGVLMGADTQVSYGSCKNEPFCGKINPKIIKMPHGILLGLSGKVGVIQILSCHQDWFDELGDAQLSKKFLVTQIVPRFYRALKERGLVELDDSTPVFSGGVIVAQRDKLFSLNQNFSVDEISSFYSVGCGLDAAYIVRLKYGVKNAFDREQMLEALRLSANVDSRIGAPFLLIHTAKLEFDFVEE